MAHSAISLYTILAFAFFSAVVIALTIAASALSNDIDVVIGTTAVAVAFSAVLMSYSTGMYIHIHDATTESDGTHHMSLVSRWLYGGSWWVFFLLSLGASLGALISGERISGSSDRQAAVIALAVIAAVATFIGACMVICSWLFVFEDTRKANKSSRSKSGKKSSKSSRESLDGLL